MEDWKLLLAGIKNFFTGHTQKIEGQVDISFPDIQKVEITNPQEPLETVTVSNLKELPDYGDKLERIIGELSREEKSADYSEIINALKEVVRTLEVDKTDYSPIIKSIENAVIQLKQKYPEFDDTQIIKAVKEIPSFDLDKYLYDGQFPVIINDKQIKKLVDAFSKKTGQIIATSSSAGDTSKLSREETLRKILGFDIPPFDNIALGYTGSNLTTVEYKNGSTTVATLTLVYTGSQLDTITLT